MSRGSRWFRGVLVALGVVVLLVIIARLVLDPIAAHFTRRALARMEGFRGDFADVHVTVLGPGYTITHLKIVAEPGRGEAMRPVLYADAVHISVDAGRLLHRQLVATVRVVEPKVEIIHEAVPPKPKPPARPPDLSLQLRKTIAADIARVEVVRGELLFRDLAEPRHPELWVHRIEAVVENLPTRPRLAHARPTRVTARGVVGRSGDMTLFATADPFAHPLAFAGRFELKGLRVAELYDFLEPKTGLQAPEGTFDLFAEFTVKDGRIEAGVKPVLENVSVTPAEGGVWDRLKAWLADEAIHLASDRVPGRNATATVIPLEGRITDPDVQVWPAILGVVRNAFVVGLTSGFADLPPPKAAEKEGALSQARKALEKSAGPPKAQPAAKPEKKTQQAPRPALKGHPQPPTEAPKP